MLSLYKALELTPSATEHEVRLSFRRLAMKWHPDRNQDDPLQAEQHFKEIARAYTILSDPIKKREYDASIPQ